MRARSTLRVVAAVLVAAVWFTLLTFCTLLGPGVARAAAHEGPCVERVTIGDVSDDALQAGIDAADRVLGRYGLAVNLCTQPVHRLTGEVTGYHDAASLVASQVGDRPDRRYWTVTEFDHPAYCGLAVRPRSVEQMGSWPAAVIFGDHCARGIAGLHELLHTLGAVRDVAHTTDPQDVMSHRRWGELLLDVDGGLYFNPRPAPGSFLAENPEWNVALSPFFRPAPVVVPEREWETGTTPQPIAAPTVTRIAGADRIATAVVFSQTHWPDGADTVYLAAAGDFPDALVAGAGATGPVLLTPTDELDPRVAVEIKRLGATTVHLVGGSAALSVRVERQVEHLIGAGR